jgi:hypothetical protein
MRFSRARSIAALGIATLAVAMFAPGAANATQQHPLSTAGLHPTVRGLTPDAAQPIQFTNFGAAYFSFPGNHGGLASASATFTMPATWSCQSNTDEEWLLPGIWVLNEDGQLTQQVDVNFNCHEGTLFMGDEIEAGGRIDQGTVKVNNGDRIEASLSETSRKTIGTIRDLTTGASVQVAGKRATNDFTVFIGEAGPTLFGISRVPSFSFIPFSKVQINGQYLGDQNPKRYELESDGVTVQIKTSPLFGDGDAFRTSFAHH